MIALRRPRATLALYILCLGTLMIVFDSTIVTVALPSISDDLDLSGPALSWVFNAYTLPFSGCLLIAGRLGDLLGRRRLYLVGIGVFVLASAVCGLSTSAPMLLIARVAQGIGGAIVNALSLSLIITLFRSLAERARALAIYGFVSTAGVGVGEVLGGVITQKLNWHWIFLVNIPIGAIAAAASWVLIPPDDETQPRRRLDLLGAILVTAAPTLLVYTLTQINEPSWNASAALWQFGLCGLLLAVFLWVEMQVSEPLVPVQLFRIRNFLTANAMGLLWSGGTFAWFVLCALYLQRVLGYSPLQVGLAFIPATATMVAFSVGLAARLVISLGVRELLTAGLVLVALGLGCFARAPLHATFITDVLPGMLLQGLGAGVASTPFFLAATDQVDVSHSGVASGVLNTGLMLGGAIGLPIASCLAAARSSELMQRGLDAVAALNSGFHLAFLVSAGLALAAAALGVLALQRNVSEEAVKSPQTLSRSAPADGS